MWKLDAGVGVWVTFGSGFDGAIGSFDNSVCDKGGVFQSGFTSGGKTKSCTASIVKLAILMEFVVAAIEDLRCGLFVVVRSMRVVKLQSVCLLR